MINKNLKLMWNKNLLSYYKDKLKDTKNEDRGQDINKIELELIRRMKHKDEFIQSSIEELRFERMEVSYLLCVLNELKAITGELESKIIDNAIERHEIDKLIHAKTIFK
jgi:hypothetical protein